MKAGSIVTRWYPRVVRIGAGVAAGVLGGYAVELAAAAVPGLPPLAGTLAFWAVFVGAFSKGFAAAKRLTPSLPGQP
jgi:hypothetical protein